MALGLNLARSVLASAPPTQTRRERVVANLIQACAIDAPTLARARTVAERTLQPVEQTLSQMGVVTDRVLADAYASVCG